MRLDWLPDVLRAEGVNAVQMGGWLMRGGTLGSVEGVVCHHTATPKTWSDTSVLNMLAFNGNPTTPPPLAQIGLARDGTAYVVCGGKANHNGYGTYVPGRAWGNQSIGIEAFNDGVGEPWPPAQMTAYVRCCAAILRHLGLGVERCAAHRETDPRRKIDPRGIDMDAFRREVKAVLEGEDDMPSEQFFRELATIDEANEERRHREVLKHDQDIHDSITRRMAEVNSTLKAIQDKLPG